VKACREYGINVPIIPGLKPMTTKTQLTVLPRVFYIDLPEELSDAVEKCKTKEEVRQVGVEWAIKQSKELMKFGVPCLHYYSMGKSKSVLEVARELF
jgi:methylenetetrahydrofolate reductase (NADPH)